MQHVESREPGFALVDRVFDGRDAVLVLFPEAMEREMHVSLAAEVDSPGR